MILVKLEPESVFSEHPEAKAEFISWAMSDSDFLTSFVELIATGWSPCNSHPANLDRLREQLHTAFGDTYHADAMKSVQEAKRLASEAISAKWSIEHRLKTAKDLLPFVFEPNGEHKLKHSDGDDREWCNACKFLRAIKGE